MVRMRKERRSLGIAFVAIAFAVALSITGCVVLRSPSGTQPIAAGPGSQPERQIVVTIRDSDPGLRASPGSTARAYSTPSTMRKSRSPALLNTFSAA